MSLQQIVDCDMYRPACAQIRHESGYIFRCLPCSLQKPGEAFFPISEPGTPEIVVIIRNSVIPIQISIFLIVALETAIDEASETRRSEVVAGAVVARAAKFCWLFGVVF